jgi:hypothetical protein
MSQGSIMDCLKTERLLSEYMESTLPAEEASQVEKHLESCGHCSALLKEMQSVLALCKSYPTLELSPDFLERILLRTSGRPRTRSIRERLRLYVVRPLLTPKFAVGASLATLFLALMANLLIPRISMAVSDISPLEVFRFIDRGVQQVYGEGLKAYNKMNEWQDQFNEFKNGAANKFRFMMERIEVPVEGQKKSEEPVRDKERSPKEKRTRLLSWPA